MTCEFETPMFIFWAYPAVIVLSFALAFLVLLRDRRNPVNRNAFYFIFIIALWITNDFAQWVTRDAQLSFFLARIAAFIDISFLFFLYFVFDFVGNRIRFGKKILLATPFLIEFLFMFSSYNLRVVDMSKCSFQNGPLVYYGYLIDLSYAIWATSLLIRNYRNPINTLAFRQQAKILILSIWFFTVSNFIYWSVWDATFSSEISIYYMFCVLFLISLFGFAIIKRNLFEFRIVPTEGFAIFVLSALFLAVLFFQISGYFVFLVVSIYALLLLIFWKM